MLKFVCPTCKGTHIEERLDNATVLSVIETIQPTGEIDYRGDRDKTVLKGDLWGYQCEDCGRIICDADGDRITYAEALAEWLQEQPYNQEANDGETNPDRHD